MTDPGFLTKPELPQRPSMGRVDGFDTPPELATILIELASVGHRRARLILDPAMGSGNLLSAAAAEYGTDVTYAGCDLDPKIVRSVGRREPDWSVGVCDFLKSRSRASCAPLRNVRAGADLVLLNPPFSHRGSATRHVEFEGEAHTCGIALAFLVTALDYLSTRGVLAAVLPVGSLTSEKDEKMWAAVRSLYEVEVPTRFGRGTFEGAFAQAAVARLVRKTGGPQANGWHVAAEDRETSANLRLSSGGVLITRGNVRMHEVERFQSASGVPLVHTTDLPYRTTGQPEVMVNGRARRVIGPAVLLPRVGKPARDKLTLLHCGDVIAPSDCVLALHGPPDAVEVAWEAMRSEWKAVEELYGGSCAPYLTVRRVATWLATNGVPAAPFLPRMTTALIDRDESPQVFDAS